MTFSRHLGEKEHLPAGRVASKAKWIKKNIPNSKDSELGMAEG
jgi:hypothetical protein